MNSYELTVVYSPELSEIKRKNSLKTLETLITKAKGKVVSKDNWGQKPLSYPIKKHTSGYYIHWLVQLPPQGPTMITQQLHTANEEVLRFLFIKTAPKATTPKKKKPAVKKIKASKNNKK